MTIHRSPRPHRPAFTIIELLVVISIIVLLLAILLPALAGARKSAKKNVCLTNLKMAADAAVQFTKDNRGFFPAQKLDGSALGPYELFGEGANDVATSNRPLNLPLKNAVEVARCPLDQGSSVTGNATHAWNPTAPGVGSSYWYPPAAAMGIQAIQPVRGLNVRDIRYPGKKLVTADLVINWSLDADDPINQWHNGRDPLQVSVAFADGHSEFEFRKLETEWNSKSTFSTVPEELLQHPTANKKAPYY